MGPCPLVIPGIPLSSAISSFDMQVITNGAGSITLGCILDLLPLTPSGITFSVHVHYLLNNQIKCQFFFFLMRELHITSGSFAYRLSSIWSGCNWQVYNAGIVSGEEVHEQS